MLEQISLRQDLLPNGAALPLWRNDFRKQPESARTTQPARTKNQALRQYYKTRNGHQQIQEAHGRGKVVDSFRLPTKISRRQQRDTKGRQWQYHQVLNMWLVTRNLILHQDEQHSATHKNASSKNEAADSSSNGKTLS
jgi:hypothetical protein